MLNLDDARADATASSGGGFAFLVSHGATLLIAGVLAFFLPVEVAALVILFQGGVALPAAFAIERALRYPKMAPDNPLRSLSIQMAMTQVLALPAVIIVYALNPVYVPAAFAAIGGGHFLPYAWLHRTRIYTYLGVAVSLGSFAMMVIWGAAVFPFVPLFWSACYWTTALYLRSAVRNRPAIAK